MRFFTISLLLALGGCSKPDTGTPDDTSAEADADTDTDADTDADADTDCVPAGSYGSPDWSLDVRADCSALLKGFCGDGDIEAMPLDGGAFSLDLIWRWQGGGPAAGEDEAIFVGTIASGEVDGTLSWGAVVDTVHAELGVTPGTMLGLANCPLD